MKGLAIMLACLAVPAAALPASVANVPPGGPAPKQLLGTWTTTLTDAAAKKAPFQQLMPTTHKWVLVILNSGVGAAPRVLGLRPSGQNAPSEPFGVQAHSMYLQCLDDQFGLPARGHDTYSWSLRNGTLRFKLVSVQCRNKNDRNTQVVLVYGVWRHGRAS